MMTYLSPVQVLDLPIPGLGSHLVLEPEVPFEGASSFDRSIAHMFRSVRGRQVMLDHDLAILYGVVPDELRELVALNIGRFAKDSLLMLEREELEELTFGNPLAAVFDDLPFAFTGTGVLTAAYVVGSAQSIAVGTRIIDLFLRMQGVIMHHSDILLRLEQLERRASGEAPGIQAIIDDLKGLFDRPSDERSSHQASDQQ